MGSTEVHHKMDELNFLVQGSAEEPYKITFIKEGTNLSAYCACPAGENGQYCKHRFGIMEGDTKGIVSGNEMDVATIVSWLKGTDVEAAINEMKKAERELEVAKKQLSAARRAVAKVIRS